MGTKNSNEDDSWRTMALLDVAILLELIGCLKTLGDTNYQ